MRPTCTTRLAATALAASLLAACSSGNAAEDPTPSETTTSPTATDTPTPDETTTSESPSSTETEGMTVEEAQQIVDATTAIYNEATIRLLEQQRIGTKWYDQMGSIYQQHMVDLFEQAWTSAASRDFEGYDTTDPAGIRDEVLEVALDQGDCFIVNIRRDFTGVTADGSDEALGVSEDFYIAFIRAEDDLPEDNATGWIRKWDLSSDDGPPLDLCDREPSNDGGEASE